MDFVYGLPLIAVLVLAWFAARQVANRARRQRELLRRQKRRSQRSLTDAPETVTSRSDMRSTDSPVTVIEKIRQRVRAPEESAPSKQAQREK